MCSDNDIVLSVRNVSKCFEMYEKPVHRLYQTLCAGKKRFYKEFWALRDINFEVRKGECIGIIGRNGAGKSTLLQILFFATPIFYPISAVPERFRVYLESNPLTLMIEQARNVFLYSKLPDWSVLAIAFGVSLLVLQLGYFFFIRTKRGFADVL